MNILKIIIGVIMWASAIIAMGILVSPDFSEYVYPVLPNITALHFLTISIFAILIYIIVA